MDSLGIALIALGVSCLGLLVWLFCCEDDDDDTPSGGMSGTDLALQQQLLIITIV